MNEGREEPDGAPGEVTRLLGAVAAGDSAAAEKLYLVVYEELRVLAGRVMRDERRDHTLQPTALVNEAWMKLHGERVTPRDKQHFLITAARAMKRILLDYAKARERLKRGGVMQRVELQTNMPGTNFERLDVLAVDEAIQQLRELNVLAADLVELRFFGGLTEEQAALALGLKRARVQDLWVTARAFVTKQLR